MPYVDCENFETQERKMKSFKYVLFVLVLVSAMLLSACGGAAEEAPAEEAVVEEAPVEEVEEAAAEEPAEEEAAEESKGKIAAILTGPWDDNSWNEAAYIALGSMEEAGYETGYSESVSESDIQRVLREYADEGYQMIVAHSFGYGDGAFEVAEEYPEVNFAWAGGIQSTADNVADYDQPFYEISYAAGIVAANMSETGKLGALYGFDIPVCHSMGEAFLAGAQTVNPDVELISTAVGDWIDVAKAKEAALAQADTGVDFWIECGEGPALGAIEAAKEVDGYATGYVGDMSENGPEVVPISIFWNLEPLFTQFMDDTLDGTFSDDPWYALGVDDDVLQLLYNEGMMDEIPEEAITAADQAIADIVAGDLVVEYVPE
jgi:basic membrane protein A and related proteins